ncbi:MAG: hypothetical protein HYU70_13105 [Bacteroidetes bacterium]|nr:hypothetical protein [Bacteroidota bacterium]
MEDDQNILTHAVKEVLANIPYRPFFCLPLSAILYIILRDRQKMDVRMVTGNLYYGDDILFKQDFAVESVRDGKFVSWAGHAWVEWRDLILDLSFFRTLYSDQFTKPCKAILIARFGNGKGCLIATKDQLRQLGFRYELIDVLKDETATAIAKGLEELLKV